MKMKNWGSLLLMVLVLILEEGIFTKVKAGDEFIKTKGVQLMLNDSTPFYLNGFNAYWLMYMSSDPSQRTKVSSAFQEASEHGLTLARTWAFSDGGYRPLQSSPGSYNEQTFQGLDFVISEARKHGIRLILSLVNNYEDFGGKKQYVNWAKSAGESLVSDDDFFTNSLVKAYYKNNIKTVLTRNNSFTGIVYKEDPTIMAWELMNEPRCTSDTSGKTIQGWITEMASYLKSIDSRHLLEVGLEGFYGESTPQKLKFNPNYPVGTDFIANNQIPGIDFATVHSYPYVWLPGASEERQLSFLKDWVSNHIQDSQDILQKPVLFAEFGKSSKDPGFSADKRDQFFSTIYSAIYSSASGGGAAGGGLFWQLLTEGMDSFQDGYEIILTESSSTVGLIDQQSQKLKKIK